MITREIQLGYVNDKDRGMTTDLLILIKYLTHNMRNRTSSKIVEGYITIYDTTGKPNTIEIY